MKTQPELIICTHAACMQDWKSPQELMDTIGPVIDLLRGQVSMKQKKCLRGCSTSEQGPFIEVSDGQLHTRFSTNDLSPVQIAGKVSLILNQKE